MKLTIKN